MPCTLRICVPLATRGENISKTTVEQQIPVRSLGGNEISREVLNRQENSKGAPGGGALLAGDPAAANAAAAAIEWEAL